MIKRKMPSEKQTEFKIEKRIPMPPRFRGKVFTYPFDKMKVGDSFLLKNKKQISSVRVLMIKYGKQLKRKFSARTMPDGYRIWRVK